MAHGFKTLFTPLTLRHKTLRNRIVFGAHTANMALAGLPGARHLGYYEERARGGAAMIVVEPVPVHQTAVLTRDNFRHDDDALVAPMRELTDACHGHGTVMIQQLYHIGQHGDHDNSFTANWSPSGLPSYHDSHGSHVMTETEIEEIIVGFTAAAERARRGGFDGVELFAAYHALIDQFWTPWSNRREDRWGCSLENRMRFSAEITSRIRKAVGDDFIIGIAVSRDPGAEAALSQETLEEIAAWHDERGLIDYITCGTGSYFDFASLIPTFLFEDKFGVQFAEGLKRAVKHARVQAESHIRTVENADYVVTSGAADMVSLVRGQIADPHLAAKAQAGRPDDIRPCISCNRMCWGRRHRDYWISCLVNPSAGREFEWGGDRFEAAAHPRTVLVVGGGPAGLETARVAAERGHRVILAEAGTDLGGQFRLAGLQPRRGQILDNIEWYCRQLERLQVEVRYNTYIEADDIAPFGADAIVIATGSQPDDAGFQRALPMVERLPGIEHGNVWPVEDVMGRACRPGKRVIVLDDGGNWRGCGTAWHLAEAGHAVTIVTPAAMIAREIERTAADVPLRQRLARLGVGFVTEAAIAAWDGDGARVVSLLDGTERTIAADALILATPNIAENSLADALNGSDMEIHVIGDCLAPREANMAIYEGRKLGLML